jgi:hypothetical protein
MRTVLYKIHLFNDKVYKHGHPIHMKWKEGERERDSGETERERVHVFGCVAVKGGSVGCKNDC